MYEYSRYFILFFFFYFLALLLSRFSSPAFCSREIRGKEKKNVRYAFARASSLAIFSLPRSPLSPPFFPLSSRDTSPDTYDTFFFLLQFLFPQPYGLFFPAIFYVPFRTSPQSIMHFFSISGSYVSKIFTSPMLRVRFDWQNSLDPNFHSWCLKTC